MPCEHDYRLAELVRCRARTYDHKLAEAAGHTEGRHTRYGGRRFTFFCTRCLDVVDRELPDPPDVRARDIYEREEYRS